VFQGLLFPFEPSWLGICPVDRTMELTALPGPSSRWISGAVLCMAERSGGENERKEEWRNGKKEEELKKV